MNFMKSLHIHAFDIHATHKNSEMIVILRKKYKRNENKNKLNIFK